MRLNFTSRIPTRISSLMLPLLMSLSQPGGSAHAADLLGLYVGGAIGQSEVAESVPNPFVPIAGIPVQASDTFKEDHTAFKVMVGLRPFPLLGAELSYMGLGHPAGSLFDRPANASMTGESAFGVVYLPIPVVDVFAKAGAARIQSTVSGFAPNLLTDLVCFAGVPCGTSPVRQDRTSTNFAAGGGVQFKFDSWAVRGEYERFNFARENPHLAAIAANRRARGRLNLAGPNPRHASQGLSAARIERQAAQQFRQPIPADLNADAEQQEGGQPHDDGSARDAQEIGQTSRVSVQAINRQRQQQRGGEGFDEECQ